MTGQKRDTEAAELREELEAVYAALRNPHLSPACKVTNILLVHMIDSGEFGEPDKDGYYRIDEGKLAYHVGVADSS